MHKLYKQENNKLQYWETWTQNRRTAVFHWGEVSDRGQDETLKVGLFSKVESIVNSKIKEKINDGFVEISEDNLQLLEIEYQIEGFGTEQDLGKRHKLEQHLNEVLGWTGIGHVDGGSIGSGTMEIGCIVVDYEIARQIIEKELKGTEFEDYSRIYQMENR